MIHHVSIPAADPRHVAEVLGELLGGHVGPFVTRHFWRGPPGNPLFELYEFWVENRVMLEIATADMLPAYTRITNPAAQRTLLAARALG